MSLFLASLYARLYIFCHSVFRINLRGLGFMLRHIRSDAILNVDGLKVYLDARIAISYARLITGRWNEAETHIFIRRLSQQLKAITFWDIGANIGEMAIDFARLPTIKNIVAFEPDPLCANVIRINTLLNNLSKIEVVQAAVSAKSSQAFLANAGTPQAQITPKRLHKADPAIIIHSLDSYAKTAPKPQGQLVLLIDVEGHELQVLKGAPQTIQKYQPLIIFEFNHISRRHFTLDEVRKTLGKTYTIRRLNRHGRIDNNLADTWNCIAVPATLKGKL